MRRLLILMVGATITLGIAAGPAAASPKNQSGTGASIALNPGDPSLGQTVSFITTYPRTDRNPLIEVTCYQNGTLVWGEVGYVITSFTLGGGSSPWLNNGGGAAACTAELVNQVWNGNTEEQLTVLASTSFAATA
jgi:hypothetical protein